ncbi:MAG: phosphate acetyltransferase [Lachnospiraceae bacterium]|nr:phosphate acetyltransferase [Lachnospiraceae bacterium]
MTVSERIIEKAIAAPKAIVLPEGDEPRTLVAAAEVLRRKIAFPILLGNKDIISAEAEKLGADIDGATIIDPECSADAEMLAGELYELRKNKGLTPDNARGLVRDPMYYAVMMVKLGLASGLVSGAVNTTGDMLRPALQIIKTKRPGGIVSSAFLMELKDKNIGEDGLLVYSDCVVVPDPTAEELAQIAIDTAQTAQVLCGIPQPRVAMLSFSTKGSADSDSVRKVRQATELAKGLSPELCIDGEMQFDAAIIPEIGSAKAPGSPVAGRANVLVFPDLQAGNIGYKITQRIGDAKCFAVLQGLAAPCNDLSRGCSADDIVKTIAATVAQAE